jgi:hypothetical protein
MMRANACARSVESSLAGRWRNVLEPDRVYVGEMLEELGVPGAEMRALPGRFGGAVVVPQILFYYLGLRQGSLAGAVVAAAAVGPPASSSTSCCGAGSWIRWCCTA